MNTQQLTGTTVLLADDHAVVRLGFRLLLEGAGASVIGEADSGEELLRRYGETPAQLVIMDVSMPGIGGLAALERLRSRSPEARVLMLSAHQDALIPVRALKAGALGYLCKRASPSDFLTAAHQVSRGQRYLDPELAGAIALAQIDGSSDPCATLTDKEFSVFLQLARGRSVNQIATDFHLSPSTVGTHLYHIKQKLNAGNAAELALIACRHGLIEA